MTIGSTVVVRYMGICISSLFSLSLGYANQLIIISTTDPPYARSMTDRFFRWDKEHKASWYIGLPAVRNSFPRQEQDWSDTK